MHQPRKHKRPILPTSMHEHWKGIQKRLCQANDDQSLQWGEKGTRMMKPKSKGAGIMVSDFIDEYNGFLALTDEQFEEAKKSNLSIKKYAREFLEYGGKPRGLLDP